MTALWSINERLGGGKGIDLDPPDDEWIGEVVSAHAYICKVRADALESGPGDPDFEGL